MIASSTDLLHLKSQMTTSSTNQNVDHSALYGDVRVTHVRFLLNEVGTPGNEFLALVPADVIRNQCSFRKEGVTHP